MKKKILIVDDDPRIVDKLAMLLSTKYEVFVASNGFDALERMNDGGADVVLLDIRMPGLDGPGFVQELHKHRIQVPIILMSANSNLAAQAKTLGIRHYLSKPFDIETVETLIDRL
jgi:two-component system response regulator (stage 0 sporulation protein F)